MPEVLLQEEQAASSPKQQQEGTRSEDFQSYLLVVIMVVLLIMTWKVVLSNYFQDFQVLGIESMLTTSLLLLASTCSGLALIQNSLNKLLQLSSSSTDQQSLFQSVFLLTIVGLLCVAIDQKTDPMWSSNQILLYTELSLLPFFSTTFLKKANVSVQFLSWIIVVCFLLTNLNPMPEMQSALYLYVVMSGCQIVSQSFLAREASSPPLSTTVSEEHDRQVTFQSDVTSPSKESQNEGVDTSVSSATVIHDLKTLIANVAHDLKTPLSSFMTGLDLLDQYVQDLQEGIDAFKVGSYPSGEEQEKVNQTFWSTKSCISNIRNTNSFMLMTINRCIDYTKSSNGLKLVPKYDTIDLMETLSLPLNCMKNIQNKIEIELEPISDKICDHIITDKQWLQENVLCLLSNAVKYSTAGKISIFVELIQDEISTHSSSSLLRVNIEDTGIGMTKESMETLFVPFQQLQRHAGGTGLGLYSLSKRIDALQGKFGVQSRRDKGVGTLFWFSFPYRADEMSKTMMPRIRIDCPSMDLMDVEHRTVKPVTPRFKAVLYRNPVHAGIPPLRVLIAEDSPTILKMTKLMLSKHQHVVEVAENGEIALNVLTRKWKEIKEQRRKKMSLVSNSSDEEVVDSIPSSPYDVVLMDLQMPIMDGLEAVRRLRAYERSLFADICDVDDSTSNCSTTSSESDNSFSMQSCRPQFIIGVTANSDVETIEESYRAGMDKYISKPFHTNTFYDMMILRQQQNHHFQLSQKKQ